MTQFLTRSATLAILAGAAMPAMLMAQTADPAAPAPKPVKEKKTCRTTENTASRLGGTRTCHTANEWAEIDKADSNNLGRGIQVNRGTGPSGH